MVKYKTVDITTLDGFKKYEWYVAHGWKVVRPGLFTVVLRNK